MVSSSRATQDDDNTEDRFAVALTKKNQTVGHVPRDQSRILWLSLPRWKIDSGSDWTTQAIASGPRRSGNTMYFHSEGSGGSRKSSRVVLLVAKPTPAAKAGLSGAPLGGLGACPPQGNFWKYRCSEVQPLAHS